MTTTVQQFTVRTLKILLLEEQSEIAHKYPNLELKGDVKITKHWSNPSKTSFAIFFDLIDSGESIRCSFWTKSKKEVEQFSDYNMKKCIVCCKLDVDKIFHNFQLNVKKIQLNQEISKLDLLKQQCEEKGLLKNKKSVDWALVSRIGIISKKNTQGYSDFISQLQIPFHVDLEEIPLEGPQTATEIINKIKLFNSSTHEYDVLLVIRGGGNTTDIANSFDKIELFEAMKKSKIPIITAIGHHNDTKENLFITQISDVDYSTPTSLAKCINSSVFDDMNRNIGYKIQKLYEYFLTVMNEKQYKILFQLRNDVEEWVQQFSKYHVVDITNITEDKEILFLKDGKYYKQVVNFTNEVKMQKKDLEKKNTVMNLLNKNDIGSLLDFVENDKNVKKSILKLCNDWIQNEKECKEFMDLQPICVNWKDLKTSSRSVPKLQKQKQMYSYLEENVLYHPVELEMFKHLQEHFQT
jgi:exodeoxyribonuclease VII large subunit